MTPQQTDTKSYMPLSLLLLDHRADQALFRSDLKISCHGIKETVKNLKLARTGPHRSPSIISFIYWRIARITVKSKHVGIAVTRCIPRDVPVTQNPRKSLKPNSQTNVYIPYIGQFGATEICACQTFLLYSTRGCYFKETNWFSLCHTYSFAYLFTVRIHFSFNLPGLEQFVLAE